MGQLGEGKVEETRGVEGMGTGLVCKTTKKKILSLFFFLMNKKRTHIFFFCVYYLWLVPSMTSPSGLEKTSLHLHLSSSAFQ